MTGRRWKADVTSDHVATDAASAHSHAFLATAAYAEISADGREDPSFEVVRIALAAFARAIDHAFDERKEIMSRGIERPCAVFVAIILKETGQQRHDRVVGSRVPGAMRQPAFEIVERSRQFGPFELLRNRGLEERADDSRKGLPAG